MTAGSELDRLLDEATALPAVPAAAAAAYASRCERLAEQVDKRIEAHLGLREALSRVPAEVRRVNHRNHARFMASVLTLGAWEVMVRTVVWVYRSYQARGLPADYFPCVVESFLEAVQSELPPDAAAAVAPAYRFLRKHHSDFVALAASSSPPPRGTPSPWYDRFLSALLRSDMPAVLSLAREAVTDRTAVVPFYLETIGPAMEEVGRLWETGRISTAQEHIATAMVGRAMAALYERHILGTPRRGRAVVACATGEFHELGARMVADLLEMDGWDVRYAGADVPVENFHLLCSPPPFLVALSASMYFHVPRVRDIIAALRSDPTLAGTRIIVGGRAFSDQPELPRRIGADAWGASAEDAVRLARSWWEEAQAGAR